MWSAIRTLLKFVFGITFGVTGLFWALGGFFSLTCLASDDSLVAFRHFLKVWLACFYITPLAAFMYFILDEF